MKPSFLSRRDLIFSALGATATQAMLNNPLSHLIDTIYGGMVKSAFAEANGLRPRKYIFLPLMGGPPRWTFIPFFPHADDLNKFVYNPMIGTRFAPGSRYHDLEYKTVPIGGLEWPWLYRFQVGRAGGGLRAMRELTQNMHVIRGIHARSDHAGQFNRYQPADLPYTFGSLISDRSPASLPAVNYHAERFRHISLAGKSAVTLYGNDNALTEMLEGLTTSPRRFHSLTKGSLKGLIQNATREIERQALEESHGFMPSTAAFRSAEEAMERGFGELGSTWNDLVEKYRAICRTTVSQTLEGINDNPIGLPVGARTSAGYSMYDDSSLITNDDLRSIITPNTIPLRLAESFALIEFTVLNGLSDHIASGILPLTQAHIELNGSSTTEYFYTFDEHGLGSVASLINNTYFNLCLGACLLELFDRLKAANLFDDVLIDVSSEMGRNPRMTASGSDHGGEALDCAMWSGAFTSAPQIVGNTLRTPPPSYVYGGVDDTIYAGSWGYGDSNPGVGQLTLGHLAATQAQILRVPNPVRSLNSLLIDAGGKFASSLGLSRVS